MKLPFGLEITAVVRYSAMFDVYRFLLILGPMIAVFHACTNVNPSYPPSRDGRVVEYVLYSGNRHNLSDIERDMLWRVQEECGKQYRNNLPALWKSAVPTLRKALYLGGCSVCLPVVSAIGFLTFQKRDAMASLAAILHFAFEILSIIFGIFASWFISDRRLCFLSSFSKSISIPAIFWTCTILSGITYKAAVLYCLDYYIRNYCKNRNSIKTPTPEEELQAYLKELKQHGIAPKVRIHIPKDPSKRDWNYVDLQIKRLLQDVRVQVAELHKDDPLVNDLLKTGKLQRKRNRQSGNVIKIAQKMQRGSTEYTLLTQHQYESRGSRDEIEIILPEPGLRTDPDAFDK